MTLYLKYRPQKIADLDLTDVRETLAEILQKPNLPHAFLFAGPRGLGKTSAARILAKSLNCLHKKQGEPCNECANCLTITSGAATDILEIDAASNRGIDEIRTLRDGIKLSPLGLKYKVYIIDEVHMLTTEAANALLKTLEEPPAHAVFILCTTDPQKLPETVVSRCTRINFKMPTQDELVDRLQKITHAEKISGEKSALKLIAKASRGSFRDAVKILEQVWLAKGEVNNATVEQSLGILESAAPEQLIDLWRRGATDESLKFIDNLVASGVNLRTFIESMMENLHAELLATRSKQIVEMIEKLDRVYEQTRQAAIPQLPLEMLVISSTTPELRSSPPKLGGESLPKQEEVVQAKGGTYKLEDVRAKWPEILKNVKPKNNSVEALLRSTTPMDFDGQELVLEVFYKFHKDKLETDKCRMLVEESVASVFGIDNVHLKLQLGTKHKSEEISAEAVEEDLVAAAAEIFKVDAV